MNPNFNILILGSESTRAAISILRALNDIENKIYVGISQRNKKDRFAFKKYAKEFWYYNHSSQDDFIKSLISFRQKTGDLYIYCIGDERTEWLILNKEKLNKNNIFFEAPDIEGFNKMLIKPEFIKTVYEYGILIPTELNLDKAYEELNNKKQIVLKANDTETLKKYKAPLIIKDTKKLNEIDLKNNNFIIQQYIDGPSVYYSAYYKEGLKIRSFEQINLVQQPNGGSVLKAAPFKIDQRIIDKTDIMFKDLNWSGVMMIEYKLEDDKYYAIECNPRYWGPNQLLIDNNVNLPKLMLGLEIEDNDETSMTKGYKWINGYILGFIYKIKGQGKFQRYKVQFDNKIKYFDLWNRKDTRKYFYLEVFLTTVVNRFKKLFRRNKND